MTFQEINARYVLPTVEEKTAYGYKRQDPYTKLSEVSQQLGAALYAANATNAEAPKGDDGVEDAEIIDESK